jgi:hypothetical protein
MKTLNVLKGIILFLIIFIPGIIRAQDAENISFFRKEARNERYEAGAPVFSFFASPSYLPEMGLCISANSLANFKTKRNNPYLNHSFLPLLIDVNLKGDLHCGLHLDSYWYDDLMRFNLSLAYRHGENHFWGIGFTDIKQAEKGDQTTAYHEQYLNFSPEVLFRLPLGIYAGITYQFHYYEASDLADQMKENLEVLRCGTDIRVSGIGFSAEFDSHHAKILDKQWIYLNAGIVFFDSLFSSDFTYQKLQLDYRHYIPVIRKGSLLTWRIHIQSALGDVPWTELPGLGGADDLRGIFSGQYRDKNSAFLLLEYRHIFSRMDTESLSRHSMVFWIGGGTVFPEFSQIQDATACTGFGYRYAVGPVSYLRFDLGFGDENIGFYFKINEAF